MSTLELVLLVVVLLFLFGGGAAIIGVAAEGKGFSFLSQINLRQESYCGSSARTSSEDLSILFSQENEGTDHFIRRHPMGKKQPAGQQQHQAAAQPEATVEQDRQAAQQQDHDNHEEAPKHATSALDHSQDADRHSKTRHVHSQKEKTRLPPGGRDAAPDNSRAVKQGGFQQEDGRMFRVWPSRSGGTVTNQELSVLMNVVFRSVR